MRRTWKYWLITRAERINNRLTQWALRRGWAPRAFAMLETTGRVSGKPQHTPIGNGLAGDVFWLIAAHGMQADYVRNIQRSPWVRVKVNNRWRSGVAQLLPQDDVDSRSRTLPYQWDAAIGRLMATSPVTIRIDLEQAQG